MAASFTPEYGSSVYRPAMPYQLTIFVTPLSIQFRLNAWTIPSAPSNPGT